MRKIFWSIISLLVCYLLFTIIAPPIVDKSKNKVTNSGPYPTQTKGHQLLQSFDFVGDLHCDALLWNRDLTKRSDYGHVDFPRMQEGNVAFQAFTIVTKSPKGQNFDRNSANSFDMITALSIGQRQAVNTWFSLVNRALYQCQKLQKFASKFDEKFIIIKSKSDFKNLLSKRSKDKSVIGGLLGVEGGHCLEGDIQNLDKIYQSGVRMLGPAHFFDNEMGGSAHGEKQGGLSSFGFEVIKEMQQRQMIMDVAHSSPAVIDDILQHYQGPILSSHTGVYGINPSLRNLSDKHLKAIADKDGLIGIAYFPEAIGEEGIPAIVKTMLYTKNLIGIEHVALGSDYDGSVTVPFDTTGLGLLADEMLRQGFAESEIQMIFGENLKRFLLQYLP